MVVQRLSLDYYCWVRPIHHPFIIVTNWPAVFSDWPNTFLYSLFFMVVICDLCVFRCPVVEHGRRARRAGIRAAGRQGSQAVSLAGGRQGGKSPD